MYKISYGTPESIYDTAISVMSECRKQSKGEIIGFSGLLDEESAMSEDKREWFEGYCPDWITFCGECRKRGWGRIIEEIEWLESKAKGSMIERNLMIGFNEGDKDYVELCCKALNGISTRAKLGIGKSESDRKNAESMIKIKRENEVLEKYDTDKLADMLKIIDKKEEEDGDK